MARQPDRRRDRRDAERDLLLISGTEPSTRWRGFCNSVLDVAEACGVETVVTFGSLIADVAHTRPVPITGLATDGTMIDQLGFEDVAYEGPTGVLGIFHAVCRERGMSAASLWAAVRTTPQPSPIRRRAWRCCGGSRA